MRVIKDYLLRFVLAFCAISLLFLGDFFGVIIQVSCCRLLSGGYIILGGFSGGLKKYIKFEKFGLKKGDNNIKSCKTLSKSLFVLFNIGASGGIKFFQCFCGRLLRAVQHFLRLEILKLKLKLKFFKVFYTVFGIFGVHVEVLIEAESVVNDLRFGPILNTVHYHWSCVGRYSGCRKAAHTAFVQVYPRYF